LAVSLYNISVYGFWVGFIFLILLTIGFVYEFGSGALKFSDNRSSVKTVTIEERKSPFPISC
jgi:NADH-ubiquinone oxidoreductase chain 3